MKFEGMDIRYYGRYRGSKPLTEEFPSVNVCKLYREGKIHSNAYAFGLEGNVTANLERMPCHFGGHQVFFCCPRCSRRCYILYRTAHDRYGCRSCLNLAYPVENEMELDRACRRYAKALKRRGPTDPDRPEGKPKWMQWGTWRKLKAQYEAAILGRMAFDEAMMGRLAALDRAAGAKVRKKVSTCKALRG